MSTRQNKLIFCALIAAVLCSTACFGSIKFSPGLKLGINFTKSYYREENGFWIEKYSYPAGLVAGIFWEIKLSDGLSVINELSFIENKSGVTASTVPEYVVEDEFRLYYLRFPLLLKYQTSWAYAPYFVIGVDLGYLVKAEYESWEWGDKYSRVYEKTDELSSVDTSVNLGVGKKLKLSKIHLVWEARGLLGLTKYDEISDRRNCTIQLVFGIQFR